MPRTRSIAWAQLKIGIIGVAAMVLATALILAVGGQGGFFWQRYPIKALFNDVLGMKSGAIVRVAGSDVGKVTSVEFSGARVEVVLEISKDVRHLITDQSVGSLGSLSLLGEPIVVITPSPQGRPLQDWEYLRTSQSAGAVAEAAAAASGALTSTNDLLKRLSEGRGTLGKLMTDEALYAEMTALATAANAVTRQINSGRGTVGALMNDPAAYNSMRASLTELEGMLAKVRRGEGTLGALMNDPAMSKSMTAASANMEAITGRISRGEGTMGKLLTEDEMYTRMDAIVGRLDALIGGLSSGQGTAGQLLQDKKLYDNMNTAATSLNELIAAIRNDPKKYLTVRVSIFGGG
jgi:phospholipid/cholesterol/gamma-HCH transport system substrate-binding protein